MPCQTPRPRPSFVLHTGILWEHLPQELGFGSGMTCRRRLVRDLGVKPLIARRGTGDCSGLGTQRWFVERAFARLRWFRRLRIRWEIRDDNHEAFLALGCALICRRRLNSQ